MVLYFWERSASVWIALLYVLMGGLLLAFPAATSTVFVWALAGGAACYGVSHLLRYLQTRKNKELNLIYRCPAIGCCCICRRSVFVGLFLCLLVDNTRRFLFYEKNK